MSSLALRLADLVIEDPEQAANMARAIRANANRAAKARAVRAAPRKAKEKSAREVKRERTAAVREAVFARDHSKCFCGADATDLHHALSGPDRQAKEHERTCLSVCRYCHRALHRGDMAALTGALERCIQNGMTTAAAAIERRITKIVALMATP